jgi:tRNA(fMet)-specific endonuclease VapC
MIKYLLDTNICIYYLKGMFNLDIVIKNIGLDNCFISEITIAELKYGIENSEKKEENEITVKEFIDSIQILPIISCLDIYAKEKVRLKKIGMLVDDFDLLIGSTAIANNLTLVTRNIEHFNRIENLKIENWIDVS